MILGNNYVNTEMCDTVKFRNTRSKYIQSKHSKESLAMPSDEQNFLKVRTSEAVLVEFRGGDDDPACFDAFHSNCVKCLNSELKISLPSQP